VSSPSDLAFSTTPFISSGVASFLIPTIIAPKMIYIFCPFVYASNGHLDEQSRQPLNSVPLI
jgi:hypothetical protein